MVVWSSWRTKIMRLSGW